MSVLLAPVLAELRELPLEASAACVRRRGLGLAGPDHPCLLGGETHAQREQA